MRTSLRHGSAGLCSRLDTASSCISAISPLGRLGPSINVVNLAATRMPRQLYARAASTSAKIHVPKHDGHAPPPFRLRIGTHRPPKRSSPGTGYPHKQDWTEDKFKHPQKLEWVDPNSKIRQELRRWHEDFGQADQDISQYLGNDIDPDKEKLPDPAEFEADGMDELDLAFESPHLDELDPQHRILRPGDLVEMHVGDVSHDPVICVFVRRLGLTRTRQYFTVTNKWVHAVEESVGHVVPYYIDPDLLQPLIPHLPNNADVNLADEAGNMHDVSVPREASAPIISRLSAYRTEVQDLYRRHAARLDKAHDLLADERDLKYATLTQIAQVLMERDTKSPLTPVELSVVRLALTRAGYCFHFDRKLSRMSGAIGIRSKAKVQIINEVQEWIRMYRDELAQQKFTDVDPLQLEFRSYGGMIIQNFARKAVAVIKESRSARQPTQMGTLGPTIKPNAKSPLRGISTLDGVKWSPKEHKIVKFMEAHGLESGFRGLSSLEAQIPTLLKATGMYNNLELWGSTTMLFLQEVGHIPPWENRMVYDETVLLPKVGQSPKLALLAINIKQPTAAYKHMTADSLEHVRRDKATTFTYCLDSAGALEIDDGISIDTSSPDGTWVHIDVANPTAFLHPEGKVARIAQHMTETIYMPEHPHTMLPSWMSRGHFSLESGRPCLRFSAKLDDQGVVLEYNVTAGHSHNVLFVDPSQVNKALGVANNDSKSTVFSVGGQAPDITSSHSMLDAENMTPTILDDLGRLLDLANKRSIVRGSKDGINLNASDRDVSVWKDQTSSKPGTGWKPPAGDRARRFLGDPIIATRVKEFSPYIRLSGQTDARGMVAEYMLLASYIASKWMHDRGLANLYRGSLPVLASNKETPSEYFHRVLVPIAEKNNGMIPEHLCTDYLLRSNPSTISMDPLKHDQLGLTHYSRVTSPLRRYADMVSHWQIGAALIEEARIGRQLQPDEADKITPFSRKKLEAFVPMLMARETRIKRLKVWGIRFWTSLLMFRAVHFGEFSLPKVLTVFVTQIKGPLGYSSVFKQFNIPCIMQDAPADTRPGDHYEVSITKVDVFNANILVKAVRLIERSEYISADL